MASTSPSSSCPSVTIQQCSTPALSARRRFPHRPTSRLTVPQGPRHGNRKTPAYRERGARACRFRHCCLSSSVWVGPFGQESPSQQAGIFTRQWFAGVFHNIVEPMLPADDTQGHVTDRILHLGLHGSDLAPETGRRQEHVDALTSTYQLHGLERKVDEPVVEVGIPQGGEQPVIAPDAPRRALCPPVA